ncbi:MAG: biotin--[acetyl-CoA-carboxylase] ligase [Candidatus Dactylopiibacterium sp.]|nr:biotin--[acetyl-CoA-carboxylase] ligase [Candidatus Dactylopiibacterium sp.]
MAPSSSPAATFARGTSFDYPLLLNALGAARPRFDVVHVAECSSTNTELLARAGRGAASGSVLVCDHQNAGRGRRGRGWVSTPGASLTFSLLWRLPAGTAPAGLSLAVGVAVARALESLGVSGLTLKWPNDIWLARHKLGGILIEVAPGGDGLALVIGIGLNLAPDPAWAGRIGQAWTSLASEGHVLARERVLGAVLGLLAPALDRFATHGFAACQADWNARNALRGEPVQLSSEGETLLGRCGDVSALGELELITADGLRLFVGAGDVSLRAQEA